MSDSVWPHRRQPTRLPGPGILQARTLEWVAISFSNTWKWKVKVKSLSGVQLFATPWTVVYQAPPSMGFSRQEYWSAVSTRAECFTKKIFLLILPKSMLTFFFWQPRYLGPKETIFIFLPSKLLMCTYLWLYLDREKKEVKKEKKKLSFLPLHQFLLKT